MYVYAKPEQKQISKDTFQKKEPEKIHSVPNQTGIPDYMKARFENLSGFSFDNVRVHYNSDKPAQLQALAYTQGNQVYIAPGQEKHLGHELGHVIQQKCGLIHPTIQLRGENVNDNPALEREADRIGHMMDTKGCISFHNVMSLIGHTPVSPTIQLARIVKFITGITHLVQISPRGSIFESENELDVRHGQRLVIDTEGAIMSRRGPNQEKFRELDESGEKAYLWYRVYSLDETPLGNGWYVRADTLQDQDQKVRWMHSGITPSMDADPEKRKSGPRVHDVAALSVEQRSLNRIAKAYMALERSHSDTGLPPTPHVAIAYFQGHLMLQGNSDYRQVMPRKDLLEALRGIESGQGPDILERRKKMIRKLVGLRDGRYHPEMLGKSPIFKETHKLLTQETGTELAIPSPEKAYESTPIDKFFKNQLQIKPTHGEMEILNRIWLASKDSPPFSALQPRPRMAQMFMGGSLLDCQLCHWAFVIFNEVIGKKIGLQIVSSGTHGQLPVTWGIPMWMHFNPNAKEMFQRKLTGSRAFGVQGTLSKFAQNGKAIIQGGNWAIHNNVLYYKDANSMTKTMGDDSDSDIDEV